MSGTRTRDAQPSPSNIELSQYRKPPSPHDWDDDQDDEEQNVLDEDPHVRRASVQSFELYTPDEEKRVVRKLDYYVVGFMSMFSV